MDGWVQVDRDTHVDYKTNDDHLAEPFKQVLVCHKGAQLAPGETAATLHDIVCSKSISSFSYILTCR